MRIDAWAPRLWAAVGCGRRLAVGGGWLWAVGGGGGLFQRDGTGMWAWAWGYEHAHRRRAIPGTIETGWPPRPPAAVAAADSCSKLASLLMRSEMYQSDGSSGVQLLALMANDARGSVQAADAHPHRGAEAITRLAS